MARVLVTGSADGLGQMAARLLVADRHRVVLHARSSERAHEALASVPGAETAVVGDLSSIRETRDIADQVNGLGAFDAIIHNAGIGYRERRRGSHGGHSGDPGSTVGGVRRAVWRALPALIGGRRASTPP